MNTPDVSPLPPTPFPTIAMLGVGSMSGAILAGLLAPGVEISLPIRVTTKSQASTDRLSELHGVVASASETTPNANRLAVQGAQVVVLGVKPWAIHDLLREVADALEPGTVVVSVAAGVTLDSMRALVPEGVSVIRAMPNTPSLVGRGVTGLTASPDTSDTAFAMARTLFETVGRVLVVDSEAKLNALSAISGSGPAYVFLLIEHLTSAAERLGFAPREAAMMAEGTFLGASLLLEQSDDGPAELRRRVTSPQGTTERAIEVFQDAGLDGVFDRALAAAIKRSEELAGD